MKNLKNCYFQALLAFALLVVFIGQGMRCGAVDVSPLSSSMASSSTTGGVLGGKVFYFSADGVPAREVAVAILGYYACSVLVFGELGDKHVSARLVCTSIDDALSSLSFLLGCTFRKEVSGIYFVGGSTQTSVKFYPSYGLLATDLSSVLKDTGQVVADKLVVETGDARAAQIGHVLEGLKDRPSIVLDLYMLNVQENSVELVNAWLQTFTVAAGYFQDSATTYISPFSKLATASAGALGGSWGRARGFQGSIDAQASLSLVNLGGGVRVDSHEQVQVISGGTSTFTQGEVLEDVEVGGW